MAIYQRPIITYKENENPWITFFKKRVERDNNCIVCIITGGTGSGKSYAALSLKHLLEPETKLQECFFFKAHKLLGAIRKYYYGRDNWKKGKLWILDEAGVDISNTKYYDDLNQSIGEFLQTTRHRNYIFIMTVPGLPQISKKVRTLINCQWEAKGFIRGENLTKIVPTDYQYNFNLDRAYKRMLLVRKDGFTHKCGRILLPKPPAKVCAVYEKAKNRFTDSIMYKGEMRMRAYEESQKNKIGFKPLTPKQKEILKLVKSGKMYKEIAELKGISPESVRQSMRLVQKKGIKLEKTRLKNGKLVYKVHDLRKMGKK